jgi:AraC-like DNA-binding protein
MPIHKKINLNNVLFVSKIAMYSDHEIHTHDALEISVLIENNAIYRLSHRDYEGKPGDVFIFRPFEPHWTLLKEETKPAKWIMILFSPSVVSSFPDGFKMLAPFYSVDIFPPLISGEQDFARHIRDVTLLAVKEEEEKLPGWQAKQSLFLMDVLITIYRCYLESIQSDIGKDFEPGIIAAIEYILENFLEDIDTNLLISLSNLKKTWFFNKFQKVTGLSPNQFITKLRLDHASHLLKKSSSTITEIAFESGFHSLSYFNRVFKEQKGVSPSHYRIAIEKQ